MLSDTPQFVRSTRYLSLCIYHLFVFSVIVYIAPAQHRALWQLQKGFVCFMAGWLQKQEGRGDFLPPPTPRSPEQASPGVVLSLLIAFSFPDHLLNYWSCKELSCKLTSEKVCVMLFRRSWQQSCHNDDKADKAVPPAAGPKRPFAQGQVGPCCPGLSGQSFAF